MAPLTQCLPVRSVPEELRVSSVRDNVIYNRRRQPSQALRCHVPDTPHRADEALSVDALLGRKGSTSVSLTPHAIARFLVQIVESNDGEMFDYEKTEDAYDYLDDQFLPCVSLDTPTAKAMGFLFLRPLHCRKDFSFT